MNIVSLVYLITFVFAVFNIVLLVESGVRPNIYTVLLMCAIVVSNGGYLVVSVAQTLEAAIVGNCIVYMGGCYLPFFIFCIGAEITKIRIPHMLRLFMFLYSSFVIGLTFTIGRLPIYYKSVDIADAGGFTVLVKEYGPFHTAYVILLVGYILASAILCTLAFIRRTVVSYKSTILYSVFLFINVGIYAFSRIFKINFEWNCIGYLLSEMVILLVFNRVEMYDMSYNVMHTWEKMEEYAYIVFDKKKKYLGSNALAGQYFEALGRQEIDRALSDELYEITALLDQFTDMIKEDGEGIKSVYRKTIRRSGRVLRSEVKYLKKKKFLHRDNDEMIGFLIEFFDVTKESDYISSIEDKNEKLAIAEKRALEASNAKTSFLSSMSHEIRTPINTILGMNEMITRESHDMVILGYARDVEKAGHMLLNLVNDVLDFSKIEAGNFEVDEKEYSVMELSQTCGNMLEKRAAEKNLRISLDVDPGMPSILIGDEGKIEQILINLITNAVKYTNNGYVRISVTGDYKAEGYDLMVSVSDTGIGIRNDDIGHIFDSFSRADLQKNRHIEGTGLGLAITKKLCEGMGGEIKVSSRYGEGSVFTVKIPQKIADNTLVGAVKLKKDNEKPKRKKYEASFTAPEAKVLIVDDNEMNLTVFVSLLKGTKVQIDKASGGNEAIEMTKNKKYDVIFMDHMMPSPDGIETMQMIRADENNPNRSVPQIALTANAVQGSMEMYMEAGFDGYLAKPVDPYELEDAVKSNIPPDLVLNIIKNG
ncbi:MAG: response regulator [Lachnospiraceae bacterium]|nr:response regulator [Lachnospiraceae bacterium]